MKIAVATENGECVSTNIIRSPYFVVLEVEATGILNRSLRRNPLARYFRGRHGYYGCGAQHDSTDRPDACLILEDMLEDCGVILSHSLGGKPCNNLRARGIKLITTEETQVERAVLCYLNDIPGDKPEEAPHENTITTQQR